jgi:4-carboxymuconolactone decarboxylase
VILRVAHRRDCAYEWSHHVEIGKKAGLTDADITAAQTGRSDDPFDSALLRAVDELDEKSNISDQTWATLGERLDERQRMDLVFTTGNYIALAMALNTFGVEVEDHDDGTQER